LLGRDNFRKIGKRIGKRIRKRIGEKIRKRIGKENMIYLEERGFFNFFKEN